MKLELPGKQTRSVIAAALLCLPISVLVGCGKSTLGVASQSDYAYAADTTEQISHARARFDRAVQLFQSAGLRAVSLNRAPKRSDAVLRAPGREAQLAFALPDNGLATMTLVYAFAGVDSQAKIEAESLLARAQAMLKPD